MLTEMATLQIILYLLLLFFLVPLLGFYMARVYENQPCGLNQIAAPIEQIIYQVCGVNAQEEMNWKQYLSAMLFFNLCGLLIIYAIQRGQFYFPLNPQNLSAPHADLAFNTAISYVTNTNWQAYSGETTMSYFTQMTALTVQNFLSAATGMSLLVAFIRGLARQESHTLGNFWVDTVRGILYILLPLAFIFSIFLVSQGVIQNFKPNQEIHSLQATTSVLPQIKETRTQTIPMGPVASQVAIKQLGTNGGGFFNANSAHPFENPNPLSNFFEILAILIIPASLCYTFGMMINDRRQGMAILTAMYLLFIPFLLFAVMHEQQGNPLFSPMGIEQQAIHHLSPGGNMEGKEARFGITNSVFWTTATTATANGSVNAALDSFTPLAGLAALWMMHLGEVVFGGVGSGLYGMLMLVIITVFIAGLMVGRTPEYLGKKIEPYEMKMACLAVLIMPLTVLITTAIAAVTAAGVSALANTNAHGFTELLYTFTSLANNNGSALTGLQANTPFYNILGGIVMLMARYWVAIPVLAIAGSLAKKKIIPTSVGTLMTHTPLFILLLISITIVIGALSFLPALALGPIVEHLMLWGYYGH